MSHSFRVLIGASIALLVRGAHGSPVRPGNVAEQIDSTTSAAALGHDELIVSDHFTVAFEVVRGGFGLVSTVLRDRASGNLTFEYQLQNETPVDLGLDRITIAGFDHHATDVANLLDAGGEAAAHQAERSLDGNSLAFKFDDAQAHLTPLGQTSAFVVTTNASEFTLDETMWVDAFVVSPSDPTAPRGIQRVMVPMYVPSSPAPIPLPPAAFGAAPVAVGFVLCACVRRRRRSAV